MFMPILIRLVGQHREKLEYSGGIGFKFKHVQQKAYIYIYDYSLNFPPTDVKIYGSFKIKYDDEIVISPDLRMLYL